MHGTPIQGTKADAYRLTQDLKSGKEVTFAFHIVENAMTSLTATCNGTTVVLNGNTSKSVLGYNWGFVVGTNSNVTVKSVAMMAGGNWQTGKVWPTGYTTGENILDVPKSAFKTAKDIDLDPERTVPAAPELSFDDRADTKYVPGAVLHHVDFGKVNSLKEVGYYVTGIPLHLRDYGGWPPCGHHYIGQAVRYSLWRKHSPEYPGLHPSGDLQGEPPGDDYEVSGL